MSEYSIPAPVQRSTTYSPWGLVDRSRYETQHGRCARQRFLSYHAGPYGYGVRRQATSLPLAAGSAFHEILSMIARSAQAQQGRIDEADVRAAIDAGHRTYHLSVDKHGMVGYLDQDLTPLIEEQQNLLTGMVWTTVLHVLQPWFEEWNILAVEQDMPLVVGCKCAAGDQVGYGAASLAHHLANGCQESSTLLMVRPDLVLQHKISGEVAYVEYKTTSSVQDRFLTEWPTKMQFAIGGLAVKANLGVEVSQYFVVGLNKSYRKGEYNPETKKYDGLDQQQSIACYGYRKLGDPPISQEEWAPKFSYTDDFGISRRLGKGFVKTSVSEYPAQPGELPAESWIKSLTAAQRSDMVVVIGPLQPKSIMLEKLARQIAGQEWEWRNKLWELYSLGERLDLPPAEDPVEYWESLWQTQEYQDLLDDCFPQSFDCRRYGEKYKCEFERLCFYEAEWDRPISSGIGYGWRQPHHEIEQEQMRERGLDLALGDEGEEISS